MQRKKKFSFPKKLVKTDLELELFKCQGGKFQGRVQHAAESHIRTKFVFSVFERAHVLGCGFEFRKGIGIFLSFNLKIVER